MDYNKKSEKNDIDNLVDDYLCQKDVLKEEICALVSGVREEFAMWLMDYFLWGQLFDIERSNDPYEWLSMFMKYDSLVEEE